MRLPKNSTLTVVVSCNQVSKAPTNWISIHMILGNKESNAPVVRRLVCAYQRKCFRNKTNRSDTQAACPGLNVEPVSKDDERAFGHASGLIQVLSGLSAKTT
jgi:hypothetical protein